MNSRIVCTRREAIGILGALALTSHPLVSLAAPKKRGIALQLYTMREPAKKDLADTLKKVRRMGWRYVQWSGMPDLSAAEIRAALDKAGLKAVAAHTGIEPFEKKFDEQLAFWSTVGVKHIAPGGMMSDSKDTLENWLKGAKRLDAVGAKLRENGIQLSYHNHSWEFEKFSGDDRYKLDILMEATNPKNLCAELDLAWAYIGGVDPAAYIRKYKGRCPVVHAKDVIKGANPKGQLTPLGKGDLNWKEIIKAGDEAGIEWYIYEQDNGKGSPFDYAQESYDFISKLVK